MLRHEGLARHGAHGGKQQGILDAARLQVAVDHEGPVAGIGAVQDFGALRGHDDKTNWRAAGSALIWIRIRLRSVGGGNNIAAKPATRAGANPRTYPFGL